METPTMGKVIVTAKIESLEDLCWVEQGSLALDQVRRVEVNDALVDTGATMLSMPMRSIAQLGLRPVRPWRVRTSASPANLQAYGAVRLTIQGRDCSSDVIGLPDDQPVLIGKIPLGLLGFVVDPVGQRLIGNPEHGGEHIIELY